MLKSLVYQVDSPNQASLPGVLPQSTRCTSASQPGVPEPSFNHQEPLNNTPIKIFFPKLEFCTDNAAMIAIAGLMRAVHGFKDLNLDLEALPRWNLETV